MDERKGERRICGGVLMKKIHGNSKRSFSYLLNHSPGECNNCGHGFEHHGFGRNGRMACQWGFCDCKKFRGWYIWISLLGENRDTGL